MQEDVKGKLVNVGGLTWRVGGYTAVRFFLTHNLKSFS